MAKTFNSYKYLPSQTADHLRNLRLGVSKRMDSGLQGQHRSSIFGSSVEFAEYREYMQGDPIERIDWNVYARTDKYVIRRFHDEVNIRANILLDVSESMSFKDMGAMSKMDYGSHLAAALMYVMINQGDSTSLATFDDDLRDIYEPAATLGGLRPMLEGLEEIVPKGESNIQQALAKATEFFKGRSMVVVISDLLQDPRETLKGIGNLSYAGHDVTVFHVLDPAEIRLPQEGLIEVEVLESGRKMNVDLTDFRDLYLQRIREYLDEIRIGCVNEGANYILVDTSTDLHDALTEKGNKLMTVGTSMFLFLLPLVAAPVVFHLLMRRQRKTVMFSTDLFFDSMKPRLSFHRKFREPLLLVARTLLLLFLLLALARLAFPGMGNMLGLGGTQAVVVVIDNSSSMQGRVEGSDRSKLNVALEGARALLKNMDERGQATVVLLVPDPSAAGSGGLTSDKGGLLNFLESIRATEATGDPGKALLRGMALLRNASSGGGGSLHVFTDLQESEWKDTALAADDVGAADSIFLHRIPSDKPDLPNICLVRAELSMRRILPNQPYFLEVLLRNDGEQDLQVRVNRTDSEHSVAETVTVDVGAGNQQLLKLPVQPKAPGRHWIRVWFEGDGFDGDNRVFVPYICEQKGDIYFLDKTSGTFGLLPLALSPSGDGRHTSLVPAFLSPADLSARIKQKTPMLVVLTWATASALDAPTSALLDQYTQQGGNLLLLPAVNAGESVGKVPAWLGVKQEPLTRTPVSLPLQVADRKSPLWSELRGLDGQVRIGSAFAKKYYPLSFQEEAGYVPLLKTGEAQTVLAIRKHGAGQVVVSGIAFGRSGAWSSLPRKKTFLVMVQPIALGAVTNVGNSSHSIVAGQTPRLMPGKGNEMSITTLLGDQIDWFGLRDQAPELVRGGAYIVSIDGRETCLTVLPSEQEGRSTFIEDSEVGVLDGIPYGLQTLANEDDFRDELQQSLAGTGLFLPLLLLAFVFLIIEGLLGAPAKKWKDRGKGDTDKNPGAPLTESEEETI